MVKRVSMRLLAMLLVIVMTVGVLPAAFASEAEQTIGATALTGMTIPVIEEESASVEDSEPETENAPAEEETAPEEETVQAEEESEPADEEEVESAPAEEIAPADGTEETSEEDTSTAEPGVEDYDTFLALLKTLEGYAEEFAAANTSYKAELLVLNYIRTGVDRYNDGNWVTLAGAEITAFTDYVTAQDAANGTEVYLLRNIIVEDFKLPNGNQTDFGHMFGTMNISWISSGSADLAGWAGDLCDLLDFSYTRCTVPEGTVEEMAAYILANCFGVDADDAFGWDDFYGDMDAYYFITEMKKTDNTKSLSELMEAYFTTELSDGDRAAYFLNGRFDGLETKDDVRAAIYDTYCADVGIQVLEADRGLDELTDMRQASCYAFADYLFSQGGDRLEGDAGSDESGTEDSGDSEEEKEMDNEYYSVFSSSSSVLAPGISQTINYAITADEKQIVYYVATVDVNRDDVTIMANYKDNDPSLGWGMQRVEDQAKALVANHSDPTDTENYIENFTAVVATNADGYNMSTGKPGGLLIMEGVEWNPVDGDGFFAILKDGTAMIGTYADYATYKDQIQEAVGGFGATLIKDGVVSINKSSNYYTSRASRTAIGITADGKVVMMVLDGRQEPFSAGGSMEEIAQIMLDAGCVEAINLDGGGSTTYLSKPEGGDTLQLVNRPSDGYARSVATSLVAVSTAKSSNEFEYAKITSEYDYLTIGTSLTVTATGVSNTGGAAQIPEGAAWQVSDETIGSITEDGVFTAAANGDVDVQMVLEGEVLGSKTLHVVVPDALVFEKTAINAIYGVPVELPLIATYNGNAVAFKASDLMVIPADMNAGTVSNLMFTGNEASGIRKVQVIAICTSNTNLYATTMISMYRADEAVFDFDDVSGGNEQLAWKRVISNSETNDGVLYQAVDPDQPMEVDYTFALDMTAIQVPEELADLTYMLPGADTGATAWDFLLQLAERVSVLTEVRVELTFDADLDVDVSGITVANDYFELKSATFDETANTLTIVANWIDQTQAIDPDTANPLCILSGIKAEPKADAAWDSEDQLPIVVDGEISYKAYLRASSLYSFALKEANQKEYGLYPYSSEEVQYNGGNEQGAYFGSTYATMQDTFTLDKTNRQGWYSYDDQMYYYVDNVAVTGMQYVPSYEDASTKLVYEFDENGACIGTVTGIYTVDGDVYYAMLGVRKVGWQSVMDTSGNSAYYYFDPYTGAAVGEGSGWIKVEGYNYFFEDYKCIKGEVVLTSGGYKYRFAGMWQRNQWVEFNGDYYYIENNYYALTDGFHWVRTIDGSSSACCLFDEYGVWQKDYNGLYHIGDDTYYIENGVRIQEAGLVFVDGYYYYFAANAKAVKNRVYWPSKTNGLLPVAGYTFDEQGRMVNPPAVATPTPTPEVTPTPTPTPGAGEEPETTPTPTPVPEGKNGIVNVNGVLYYYKDNAIQYGAGLVLLDGGYIYVRSSGQLAIGSYWITNTNDLLPQGMQIFGEDGYMIQEEPEATPTPTPDAEDEPTPTPTPDVEDEPTPTPIVKNGIVEENGGLYYYIDGTRGYGAGIVEIEDDVLIYVRSNGQLATGTYWPTNTNGIIPQGLYDFGTDGKLYLKTESEPEVTPTPTPDTGEEEPEATPTPTPDTGDEETEATPAPTPTPVPVKNGIVEESGGFYYYIDGVRAYGAGVVQLTDDAGATYYIYVRSNGQLATGTYWPTTTNGLLSIKGYDWGTDGKLYL